MNFVFAMIVVFVFSYFLKDSIKKYAGYYYIGAVVIALVTVLSSSLTLPTILTKVISVLFRYGTASTAMFTLVMYTNAFADGSKVQRIFMPIRGELSIIACILAYGHNLYTGKTYVKLLIKAPQIMSVSTKLALATTAVLILLMTPLFLTSFKKIRKKMKPLRWKMLQRCAYVFYMLIYVHVMILMLPAALEGKKVYLINVVVYSIVFLVYGTLRLLKYYKKSKNPVAILLIVAMYVALIGVVAMSLTNFEEEEVVQYDIDLSQIPDGTYEGQGVGYMGMITVTVSMNDGAIEAIGIDSYVDGKNYITRASAMLDDMVETQTIEVDIVSGATYSSNGIKAAVLDALTIE